MGLSSIVSHGWDFVRVFFPDCFFHIFPFLRSVFYIYIYPRSLRAAPVPHLSSSTRQLARSGLAAATAAAPDSGTGGGEKEEILPRKKNRRVISARGSTWALERPEAVKCRKLFLDGKRVRLSAVTRSGRAR